MLSIDVRRKAFPGRGAADETTVLRDIRLDVPPGQLLSVLGPSGCGKTTLLNLIAGLDTSFDGEIAWSGADGADGTDGADGAGGAGRPRIGYVFQNPALLPWRTVIENLTLVMPSGRTDRATARRLLEEVGLGDYADAYPKALSLGMSRRVAIARAFAVDPRLLLLDEPFVSLDEDTAARLRALLRTLWRARKPTVVFVTHDTREAIGLAQRVVVLSKGPANVVADLNVELSDAARGDPIEIERWRERLLLGARQASRHPGETA
jgi:NitT/TauT family transport system ATP-binding protein